MVGTWINVAGIVLGGLAGSSKRGLLSPSLQSRAKILLAVATVLVSLTMTWRGLGGGPLDVLRQIALIILALILGNATGRLLGLQSLSNRLGRFARSRLESGTPSRDHAVGDGLLVGTVLFCASPMAFLGAFFEGLSGYSYVLVIKAVIDALAIAAMMPGLGWGLILSCIPVLAFQGSICQAAAYLEWSIRPYPDIANALLATGGLLVFCLALIILELKKIAVANYLPSLGFAALLGWLWW
jgi:hypothetical protein